MAMNGLEGFSDDALAWLVWHFEQDPQNELDSEARNPGFPDRVRVEFAKRPQVLPRHLR